MKSDYPCKKPLHLTEEERLVLHSFIRQYESDFFDFTSLQARRGDYYIIYKIGVYLENLNN